MGNSRICLIMPPGWDITQPYLSLPQLKGFSNTIGCDIDIFDDNINFYDNIISSKFIQNKLNSVLNEFKSMDAGLIPFRKDYNDLRLIKIYEKYLIDIDKCKYRLRTTENPDEYKFNMRVLFAALSAIGHSYKMDLLPDKISSKIYNSKIIDDIINFVSDSKNNIFYEYYTSGKGKEVINKSLHYDHIGISIVSRQQLLSALTFSYILKKKEHPPIIHFGGNFITRLARCAHEKTMIKLLDIIDFIVQYEGEIVLKQLLEGTNYKDCSNIIYSDNNALHNNDIIKQIPGPYIIPNFDGFDLKLYFSSNIALPLVSSKGCYSKCAFCTIPQSNSNNKYYLYDILDIISAISQLKEKYHTKYFTFNDETFNFKRMVEFSKSISDLNIDIKWIAETRFDERISDSEFYTIVSSGCSFLEFGLESYNQRVLDLMKKNIKIENIDYILEQCLKYKLPVHLFAIFGFPGETSEEIHTTQKFILDYLARAQKNEIQYTSTGFGPFGLEYGSHVFNNPEKYGVIISKNDDNSIDLAHDYTISNGISPSDIREIVDKFTYTLKCGYPDTLPQSFVMFGSNNTYNNIQYTDEIFENNFDFEGVKCRFKYIYNFEKQWIVPITDDEHIRNLLNIYGHSNFDLFDQNLHYIINPIILFQKQIIDPIRNVQFNIPEKAYNTLLFIKKYGYQQCITNAINNDMFNEVINQVHKLYSAGLLIVTTNKNTSIVPK